MNKLRYIPLGGVGEIGMNMWALEWRNQLVVVDAGLMFPEEHMLGVDLVLPDISYLLQKGKRVLGIVLSHGHEDHIGGLPYVLEQLNVPVFGTRLTLGLVRPKLKERRILREAELREIAFGDRVKLGPFWIELIAVCHSIPDAAAVAVGTPVGTVLYTGDYKLDAAPPEGRPTDLARLAQLGDEGVLLLLGDSTNAERDGHSGSERELLPHFRQIFEDAPARIVVATFASNIHRIQQVVRLAEACRRQLTVVGRSVQTNFHTARELGYLEVPPGLVVKLGRIESVADDRLVLLMAGSQGEPLSSLARYANRTHPVVNCRPGDWVVISATPIPGNQRLVHRIINNLFRAGARVFYSEVAYVHVSGHAYREELATMLTLVRPRFFIPVHGEYRHLVRHRDLAQAVGIPPERIAIVEDGQTVEFEAGSMRRGPRIDTGIVYVDGIGIGDVEHVVLRDRQILAEDGVILVTLAVDRDTGELRAGPEVVSRGFIDPLLESDMMAEAVEAVSRALRDPGRPHDPRRTAEAVRETVSRLIFKRTRRQPMVIPLISQI